MKIGDKVKLKYGKKKEEKEGTIIRLFPKMVYLQVDFPNHKDKIIKRKRHQIQA
jgi:hypothetical protein